MSSRRRPSAPSLRAVELSPVLCARTLARDVDRLAQLRAGGQPRFENETVEFRESTVRAWIDAFRTSGRCKRCGLVLEDPVSVARGVGPDCWRKRLTDAERADIEAWVHRQAHGDEEPV